MASTVAPVVPLDRRRGAAGRRLRASHLLRGVMEAGVLAMLCLSPWAFGAVEPLSEFILDLGIASLATLWAVRMLLEGQVSWQKCPVAVCLAALILVGIGQVTPLPKSLLGGISPTTARLYDRLLPARPEVLPFGEPRDVPKPPAGSTVSVYPGATRQETTRLLAILLLFAVVRNNVASAGSLRRLSIVASINGSLLALFGLVQFFSSSPGTVYWVYPTSGGAFGPFINRNHFAFFINVCAGLGTGLLLARHAGRGRTREGQDLVPGGRPGTRMGTRGETGFDRPHRLLDPEVLGMSYALALMVSSMIFCLSRGGFLALLGASILGLGIRLSRSRLRWSMQGEAGLMTLAIALALVSWIGYDRVAARLTTFHEGRVQRVSLWARALPVVADFPLWGTGYGTYEYADTLHRTEADARDTDVVYDHAHNDYLEVLTEGGLAGLIPSLVAVVLVFRLGLRAVRQGEGRPVGALALGALVSFATVAIHSISDFGLHIPANAAIVTVLCAHLCALGRGNGAGVDGPEPAADREPGVSGRRILRLRGLAPALGAVLVVALGLVLINEGWRAHRARQLRDLAFDQEASRDPSGPGLRVAYLEAEARLVPEYARLRSKVAYAHLSVYDQRMAELSGGGPGDVAGQSASAPSRGGPDKAEIERLKREHLAPALRHFLQSRDLCPLRAEAHMEIAEHVDELRQAEPRGAYLDRAKFLTPGDPWLWYRCGDLELSDGQLDRAWESWRRSLELSDVHLHEILDRSGAHLGPRDVLRRVLPDRPGLLLEAASHLDPDREETRRPVLERALALLENRRGPLNAEDLHLKATIQRALGRAAEALATCRQALDRSPMRLDWRYELAELFYEQGRFPESRQELLTILGLQPGDVRARQLLDAVTRKIAEGV